jgi:hypothetical protein
MLIEKAAGSLLWRVAATAAAEVYGDLLRVPFFGAWEDEEFEASVGRRQVLDVHFAGVGGTDERVWEQALADD